MVIIVIIGGGLGCRGGRVLALVLVFGCSCFVSFCSIFDRLQNLHGVAVVFACFVVVWGVGVRYAPPKNGKECQSGG